MTRKIILGSCLLLVLCIFWVAWPKTNVWNEIMNGETEAVRMRIETGLDVNSICPGVDTLTLGKKWKYLSEFEWPPKDYKQWNAMSIAVSKNHPRTPPPVLCVLFVFPLCSLCITWLVF